MTNEAVRKANLDRLAKAGFRAAQWLPLDRHDGPTTLRPAREIASRLMALDAVFGWVVAPESAAPSELVRDYIQRNDLRRSMTENDLAIVDMPRAKAHAEHSGQVGWRLENMWALAWVLGFEHVPPFDGAMIEHELIGALLETCGPRATITVDERIARGRVRSVDEVDALEDLFYCAHNAARSAQLGHDTVPRGFHPIAGGGVVHERRHALTWCLSPGVDWKDTDLST
jgi:hypothetical protein